MGGVTKYYLKHKFDIMATILELFTTYTQYFDVLKVLKDFSL